MNFEEKIKKAAKYCTPRYTCSRCPYKKYDRCYEKLVEDITIYFDKKVKEDEERKKDI